jgi:hypothetical protein
MMTHFYEIRIAGHLDAHWADWFDGMSITLEEDGTTLLSGPVPDQPALYGLLRKVRDLGLPLVSVRQLKDESHQQILNTQRIEPMNANLKLDKKVPQKALEDIKLNVKLKLTALWASFMFLYIYVDYFALYMPSKIENILKGKVFVFDITQGFIMIALGLSTIPMLMIFLSVALPAKVNRWTNIIVAIVHIPYMLFNLTGEAWMHMYFAAAVEVVLLLLIIRYAWKWPKQES